MVKAADVDWAGYFDSIKKECPWSRQAYNNNKIDIVEYQGLIIPLGHFQARVYVVNEDIDVEALANELDHGVDEWLYSFPGYGPFATPVPVLIQQNRQELNDIRRRLDAGETEI